jgi:hypothetical protein
MRIAVHDPRTELHGSWSPGSIDKLSHEVAAGADSSRLHPVGRKP